MTKLATLKKIPNSVNVLGYEIRVIACDKLFHADGSELMGQYNSDSRTIEIVRHANWRSVLLHEIFHMILDFTGANTGLSEEGEERIVVALQNGLYPLV